MKAKKVLALLLLAVMLFTAAAPAAFAQEDKTVHISSVEDLKALSASCALDTYSVGLTVILDNDIDLRGEEFFPIPSFSGVFNGAGHTISNMVTATNGSHQGLFRYVQADGLVQDLHVEGLVTPSGSRSQVGGIAGVNNGTIAQCTFKGTVAGMNSVGGIAGENNGSIRACTVEGQVDGKRFTGGVVGKNTGLISACTNQARVNISISEGGLELDELNLSDIANIELTGAEDTNVVSDSGGIAGYSAGTISNCTNQGTVGYQHYGYNVGGIAGRQSGYMDSCTNYGAVYGRKDVGGIVGQMEPYMLLKSSASLSGELYQLHSLVVRAMGNVSDMSDSVRGTLNDIKESSASAIDKIEENNIIKLPDADSGPDDTEPGDTEPEPELPEQPGEISPPASSGEIGKAGEGDSGPDDDVTGPSAPDDTSDENTDTGSTDTGNTNNGNTDTGDTGSGDSLIEKLPELEPGQIQLPDNITDELDQMANGMTELAAVMGDSTGRLAGDLVAVSDQLSRVIMLVANALSSTDRAVIEDISDGLSVSDTEGRVSRCVNHGPIDGDRNVGGIAGTMGIEYEFDLEGTLAEKLGMGNILSATYQTKCVSDQNVNRGTVVGKKNDVGGVAGLMELGAVVRCEGYGSVSSSEGGYVGGIVGCANAPVRASYAMCSIDGTEYVGGIVGYGTEISGCVSLIGMEDPTTACSGAIAGWADVTAGGAVSGNVFVHDSLGAVDGISYSGKAIPVSYEQLLKLENLPDQFSKLKLSFVADGQLIEKLEFSYGGTIDQSRIPQVPEKEGYSGSWPELDYTKLYFSATLEAVYTPRQAAIAAAEQREDSPLSLLLLEGDFEDGASVSLNPYSGDGPELEEGRVVEKWAMRLRSPGEFDESYNVRFLPPEPEIKGGEIELYLYSNGQWTKLDARRNGSYLSFAGSGSSLVFCVVETEGEGMTLIITGTAALLALALLIWFGLRMRRKAKKRFNDAETAWEAENGTDPQNLSESAGQNKDGPDGGE